MGNLWKFMFTLNLNTNYRELSMNLTTNYFFGIEHELS